MTDKKMIEDIDEKTAYELLSEVEKLLNAEVKYYTCSGRVTKNKKIIIEYDRKNK
jgi:hypothetical protein